ncbi:MAG: glycosyltransferase family 39 protein [candidate division WOR-3 bacterium]
MTPETVPVPTSSHAPLYPFFLAFFYKFKITPLTYFLIMIIQAGFSLSTVYLISKTARHFYGENTARIVEFFCGLYPPLIYYCAKLVPTTIFLLLLAWTIYRLLQAEEKMLRYYLLTGCILGLAILCDPIAFVFYPAIFSWFLFSKKINFFRILVISIASIILLTPWTIRNYKIHHRFVPVTTQFGINFWIGNNPQATGTDYFKVLAPEKEDYILMTATLPPLLLDSLNSCSEIERSEYYSRQALEFIKNNPLKFICLLVKKTYYYFWFAPSSIYFSPDLEKYRSIYILLYIPLLITGLAGIFLSVKNHKDISLVLTVLGLIAGLYIFTHVGLIRYRLPVELYLLLFSGYLVAHFRRETA